MHGKERGLTILGYLLVNGNTCMSQCWELLNIILYVHVLSALAFVYIQPPQACTSNTLHLSCIYFRHPPPESLLGRTRQETRQLQQRTLPTAAPVHLPPQLPAAAMGKPIMTRSRQVSTRVTVQASPTSPDTLPSIISGGSSPPHKTS